MQYMWGGFLCWGFFLVKGLEVCINQKRTRHGRCYNSTFQQESTHLYYTNCKRVWTPLSSLLGRRLQILKHACLLLKVKCFTLSSLKKKYENTYLYFLNQIGRCSLDSSCGFSSGHTVGYKGYQNTSFPPKGLWSLRVFSDIPSLWKW